MNQPVADLLKNLLANDDPSNYESGDDAAEDIVSEIELIHEVTPEEATDVTDAVCEWYDAN